jgi:hypothetical protein
VCLQPALLQQETKTVLIGNVVSSPSSQANIVASVYISISRTLQASCYALWQASVNITDSLVNVLSEQSVYYIVKEKAIPVTGYGRPIEL